MTSEHYIGVDLGGTKLLAGIFANSVTPLARAKEPTPFDQGPAAVIEKAAKAIARILEESKVDPATIRGMGFSVPGQVNPTTGIVKYAPNLGWREVNLPALLPKTWTWPTFIENDV